MSGNKTLSIYLAVFIVAALAAGTIYRGLNWAYDVRGCKLHREPGTFMAYCNNEQYADYEHGGFYFGLESEAVANMRKAKVLFLGNSQVQIGFSTDEVNRYFSERSIPYYVLGFGYAELGDFPTAVIEKFGLKPSVLVIASDPFFKGGSSSPASNMVNRDAAAWTLFANRIWSFQDYATKKIFNTLQPTICDLAPTLCPSNWRAIYRKASNGFWLWRDLYSSPEGKNLPLDPANRKPLVKEPPTADLDNARRLFAVSGVRQDCIVLTVVPNSWVDAEPYTIEAGRLLGVRVELPQVEGLSTLDQAHLTWNSAQRWSAEFMRQIDPVIARCAK